MAQDSVACAADASEWRPSPAPYAGTTALHQGDLDADRIHEQSDSKPRWALAEITVKINRGNTS